MLRAKARDGLGIESDGMGGMGGEDMPREEAAYS